MRTLFEALVSTLGSTPQHDATNSNPRDLQQAAFTSNDDIVRKGLAEDKKDDGRDNQTTPMKRCQTARLADHSPKC